MKIHQGDEILSLWINLTYWLLMKVYHSNYNNHDNENNPFDYWWKYITMTKVCQIDDMRSTNRPDQLSSANFGYV